MSEVQRIISEMVAIHNEAQRLCAAGPWVKIEPSCEMPEVQKPLVFVLGRDTNALGFWNGDKWINSDRGRQCWPTHYAVLRMPDER